MRRIEIQFGPQRNDAGRIDLAVAGVIVRLDVIEVRGLAEGWHLEQLTQVVRQIRIIRDAAQVALEMLVAFGLDEEEDAAPEEPEPS